MSKFVLIIVSTILLGFSNPECTSNAQINEVKVEFSQSAIGIESGQPIFSKDTRVWVTNPTSSDIKLYINDDEKEMSEKKVEIAGLEAGTYTIMIMDAEQVEEKRTVGFTIQ